MTAAGRIGSTACSPRRFPPTRKPASPPSARRGSSRSPARRRPFPGRTRTAAGTTSPRAATTGRRPTSRGESLSLPVFGEGRVGFFLACSLTLADPTLPSPKTGREKGTSSLKLRSSILQMLLDAPIGHEPHQRDRDVEADRDPRLDESEPDRGRIHRERHLALEVVAD